MTTTRTTRHIVLQFDPALDRLPSGKRLSEGMSAAVAVANTLWLTHDETVSIERLVARRSQGRLAAIRRSSPIRSAANSSRSPHSRMAPSPDPFPRRTWKASLVAAITCGLPARIPRFATGPKARRPPSRSLRSPTCDEPATGFCWRGSRWSHRVHAPSRSWCARQQPKTGGSFELHAFPAAGKTTLSRARCATILISGLFWRSRARTTDSTSRALAAAPGGRLFLGLRGPVIDGWACVLEIGSTSIHAGIGELVLRKLPRHAASPTARRDVSQALSRSVRIGDSRPLHRGARFADSHRAADARQRDGADKAVEERAPQPGRADAATRTICRHCSSCRTARSTITRKA